MRRSNSSKSLSALTAVVDVAQQRMIVSLRDAVIRTYAVSTARAGLGSREGSGQTPPGLHRVVRLFGHQAVPGQVFVSRRAVKGLIIPPVDWRSAASEKDYVLTRILRLEGLEPGVNAGPGIDSFARFIYIHGTNQEHLLGTPASHGCIRLSNADVIDLFALVKKHHGLQVVIS